MPQLGPFCFKNSTGKKVTDLHVIFTGTGGTLRRARIVKGPKGKIGASKNQVNIFWPKPVAAGAVVCFTVWCKIQPIAVNTALWTLDCDVIGHAEPVPSE
jgi:hypothetical protein